MGKGYEQVSLKDEDNELPVAQAELMPFDGVEEGLPPDEIEGEKVPHRELVRVVAPSDLPPNYKLLVRGNDGTTFSVIVPKHGVQKHQTFEAEKWQPNPIEGRFSDDLFSCGSEGNFCGVSTFCTGLAFGAIMENLKLNACAGRSVSQNPPRHTYKIVAFMWFVFVATYIPTYRLVDLDASYANQPTPTLFDVVNQYVNYAFFIYLIFIWAKTRMAFRSKYKIPGNCCTDLLVSYFCNCCSSLQMYRHMKRSGEQPARFVTVKAVEAEII